MTPEYWPPAPTRPTISLAINIQSGTDTFVELGTGTTSTLADSSTWRTRTLPAGADGALGPQIMQPQTGARPWAESRPRRELCIPGGSGTGRVRCVPRAGAAALPPTGSAPAT